MKRDKKKNTTGLKSFLITMKLGEVVRSIWWGEKGSLQEIKERVKKKIFSGFSD